MNEFLIGFYIFFINMLFVCLDIFIDNDVSNNFQAFKIKKIKFFLFKILYLEWL